MYLDNSSEKKEKMTITNIQETNGRDSGACKAFCPQFKDGKFYNDWCVCGYHISDHK